MFRASKEIAGDRFDDQTKLVRFHKIGICLTWDQ